MFESLGFFVYRRRWLVILVSSVFLMVALALLARGGSLAGSTIEGLEADDAQRLADEISGHPENKTVAVVFRSPDLAPTSPEFRAAMNDALAPLRHDPRVAAVMTPDDAPTVLIERLRNTRTHAALAFVTLGGDEREALETYGDLRPKLVSNRLDIAATGHIPYMFDLAKTLRHDLLRAELLSLPVALVILLLVFRTVVAASLPVGVGGLAVTGGMAIVVALSRVTEIAQYTVNICSLIGFGVAIDYSLFIVSRYREELAAGLDGRRALVRAVATAGRAVAFSGFAVGTGLAGLFVFRGSYLAVMGAGGAIVVLLAVIFALTLLPAILAVLGPRIHAGKLPGVRSTRTRGRFWHGLATWVMRRPWATLAPTLAVLTVLALPVLHMRVAASDVRILAPDVDARRGYDVLRETFPEVAKTRVDVVVRFPGEVLTRERASALYDLSHRIAALPHVEHVQSIVDREKTDADDEPPSKEEIVETLVAPSDLVRPIVEEAKKVTIRDGTTVLYAVTDASPDSVEAETIVKEIRADRTVRDGELLVGGQAAKNIDTTHFLVSRAPYAVLLVVGVTLVVVFVLLRSLLLPVKAIVMNTLSIAASFGIMVWIFQEGHLFVTHGRPLEPALPALLFCVAFGMSMDYEILMLARMKEAYAASGDNTAAVASGLESTAGLVTSAAAIMVAVFSAFALARVVVLQATGVGLAVAVALDATLVRALLVPATMRLLGHLNWWAPRIVQRGAHRGAPASRVLPRA